MSGVLGWKALGEATIDSSNDTFTIRESGVDLGAGAGNPVTITLTQGRYGDVRVLCNDAGASDIETLVSGLNSGTGQDYTLTVDDDTGIVTWSTDPAGGNNFFISGGDWATLRTLLGFASNLSVNTSYTAPNPHQYGFYADRGINLRRLDETEIDEALTLTPKGVHAADFFFERTLGRIAYQYIVANEHEDLWSFWQDIVRQTLSFNLYPDRTVNSLYDVSSEPTGYQRWFKHEDVSGFRGEYPFDPSTLIRRIDWRLRKDVDDAGFVAVGT